MPEQQDTFTGKLSLRSNYAMIHYRAAAQAARVTHAVEQANDTSKHGAWFDEVMMHVPVAVIMAAAALEANANEIIQDNLDQLPSSPRRELLKDLISERSGSAMEKYRRLALLLDELPDQGSAVWQNADLLIRFRNFFVHFKPSWDHEIGVHEEGKLSRQLRARLPIVEAYKSGFMLPYGVLNYACAKWAVASAKDFCADFSSMTGVQDRLLEQAILP